MPRAKTIPNNPLTPSAALLAKLGSIVAHVDELLGPKRHAFDVYALTPLLNDHEVQTWLVNMRAAALVPEPR